MNFSCKSPLSLGRLSVLSFILISSLALNPAYSQGTSGTVKSSFTAVFASDTVEWNPLYTYSSTEAQIYTALYEGLLSYDPLTLKPQAAAASSWNLSEDKREYTFILRDNLFFSDGTPLSSKVFKDSWLANLDPARDCPFAGLLDSIEGAREYRLGKGKREAVKISTPDDKTLVIRLKSPNSAFLQILCHQSMVPIHPKLLNTRTWTPETLIGNGPFQIRESNGDTLHLIKSENYWDRDSVQITDLTLIFKDDPDPISESFNSGEINWIESGGNLNLIERAQTFQVGPQFSTSLLFFSHKSKKFDNADLRKALVLLMPLEKLRSRDLFLVPSSTLIPDIPFYPQAETLEKQNRTQALNLLEKAGFPKGKGLGKIKVVFPESELFTDIAKLMSESLDGLEVSYEFSFLPPGSYYSATASGDFDIANLSWIGDYADPMTFLDLYISGSSLNQSLYSNPEYDKLIEEAQMLEGKARYEKLSKAESLLLQSAQVIPLSNSPSVNVIDLELIGGWYKNPLNIHPFKSLFIKTRKPPKNVALL